VVTFKAPSTVLEDAVKATVLWPLPTLTLVVCRFAAPPPNTTLSSPAVAERVSEPATLLLEALKLVALPPRAHRDRHCAVDREQAAARIEGIAAAGVDDGEISANGAAGGRVNGRTAAAGTVGDGHLSWSPRTSWRSCRKYPCRRRW